MEKVKTAVIGIGNMGTAHAQSLWDDHVPGLALAAVCDTDPARLAYAAKAWPGVACYASEDALLAAGGVQAAIVAVPHPLHSKIASLALAAGLHVLVEKPLDVRLSVAQALCAQAKASGKVFALMLNQRTNPLFAKARAIVQGGQLGQLKRSVWIITNWYRSQRYYDSGSWRATWAGEGGGVLLNQCPHQLDLVQWLVGLPCKVQGFCHEGKWHNIEVEDDVTAYFEYPNGATGVFITTTADAPGTNRLEITGTKATLICQDGKLIMKKLEMDEREWCATCQEGFRAPSYETIEVETDGQNGQHPAVLNAFAAHILRGEPLVADGREGINGLMLSNAIHLSSWLGHPVTLPIDEKLFLEKLNERRATSRAKTGESVFSDTNGTYGSK